MPVFVAYTSRHDFEGKHFDIRNVYRSNSTPESGDTTYIEFSVYCYDYGEGYTYQKYLKSTDLGPSSHLQIVDDQGYSHLLNYIGGSQYKWRLITNGLQYQGQMNKVVTYPLFTCTYPPQALLMALVSREFTTLTWNPGSSGGGNGKIVID